MSDSLTIRNRYEALKEASRVAVTLTTSTDIFRGFCTVASKFIHFDRAGLMIYDPQREMLRVEGLSGSLPGSFFRIGTELSPQQTPHGLAFQHQRIVIRKDISTDAEFDIEQVTLSEGLRSYCAVPLVVRGSSLGVVTMLTYKKRAYAEEHAHFLQEMSDPIALAIASLFPFCGNHPKSALICPRCIASVGGRRTATKYKDQLSQWGKQGGRGKKRSPDETFE